VYIFVLCGNLKCHIIIFESVAAVVVEYVNRVVSVFQHHHTTTVFVCIYGSLYAAARFTFESHRYHTSPFSLTLYVNGKQDCRLSVCCEYKHKAGVRLGGKRGHFGIVGVEGSSPCYRFVNTHLLLVHVAILPFFFFYYRHADP